MTVTATNPTGFKPTDKLLFGIVLAVVTFWLFAMTTLNIMPTMQKDLGIDVGVGNLAVSITSLFSGIFIVVAGGLADRFGRVRLTYAGLILGLVGSALIALTPGHVTGLTESMLMAGRILQGLSAACIMPSTMAIVKAYYDGAGRQRALSFWSIGSWGGSGAASLFGGFMAGSLLGWRSIFWMSVIVALISMWMIKGTPESKVERTGPAPKFDWAGLIPFIIALLALNIYISQGAAIGWVSPAGLALIVVAIVAGWIFLRAESGKTDGFVDLSIFKNMTFTGATLSNFLLNGAAGALLVALSLVQQAAGFTVTQAGLLTVGYLVAILATIRVGEKLLQRFGPKKPMIWGCLITGIGIVLTSMTWVMVDAYVVLAVVGFTLFGIGLGFYATPSTDAALANVPADKAGSASGVYKMASSLGSAIGVAISAAIYTGLSAIDSAQVPLSEIMVGRQDNISERFAGLMGLGFNVLLVVLAIIAIMITVPNTPKKETQIAAKMK